MYRYADNRNLGTTGNPALVLLAGGALGAGLTWLTERALSSAAVPTREVIEWIDENVPRGAVIFGFGLGRMARRLGELGYHVFDVEYDRDVMLYGHENVEFIYAPLVRMNPPQALPTHDQWYDPVAVAYGLFNKRLDLVIVNGPSNGVGPGGFLTVLDRIGDTVPIIVTGTGAGDKDASERVLAYEVARRSGRRPSPLGADALLLTSAVLRGPAVAASERHYQLGHPLPYEESQSTSSTAQVPRIAAGYVAGSRAVGGEEIRYAWLPPELVYAYEPLAAAADVSRVARHRPPQGDWFAVTAGAAGVPDQAAIARAIAAAEDEVGAPFYLWEYGSHNTERDGEPWKKKAFTDNGGKKRRGLYGFMAFYDWCVANGVNPNDLMVGGTSHTWEGWDWKSPVPVVRWLSATPASDTNFKSHLASATAEEIRTALAEMGSGPGNKSRIDALERRLRQIDPQGAKRKVKAKKRRAGDPDVPRIRRLAAMLDVADEERFVQWVSDWIRWRRSFVARHAAQLGSEGFDERTGQPTRQHLGLVMWAASPDPDRLRLVLGNAQPQTTGLPPQGLASLPNKFPDSPLAQMMAQMGAHMASQAWAKHLPVSSVYGLLIHPQAHTQRWTAADASTSPLVRTLLQHPGFCKPKECFHNAAMIALTVPEVRYAEGYTVGRGIPMPIHHAWNVLPDGSILDCTFCSVGDRTMGSEYIGVIVPDQIVRSWVGTGEPPSVFDWQKLPDLMENLPPWLWGSGPSATTGGRFPQAPRYWGDWTAKLVSLPPDVRARCALLALEMALPIIEQTHPHETAAREAVDAARSYLNGNVSGDELLRLVHRVYDSRNYLALVQDAAAQAVAEAAASLLRLMLFSFEQTDYSAAVFPLFGATQARFGDTERDRFEAQWWRECERRFSSPV